jgi:hypothetical protein
MVFAFLSFVVDAGAAVDTQIRLAMSAAMNRDGFTPG